MNHAFTRCFHWYGAELPLDMICEVLQQRPDMLYHIHHTKMEELVAFIMSALFINSKVTHWGQAYDGGIDLILVFKDTPIAIQVKRRTRPDCVEPVAPVREFIGACLLRGIRQCIYVSNAPHFSPAAHREARRAVSMQLVERLELIEKDSLLKLLATAQLKGQGPWRSGPFTRPPADGNGKGVRSRGAARRGPRR